MVRESVSGPDTFGGVFATARRNFPQNCGSPNDQGPTRDDILDLALCSRLREIEDGDGGDGGGGATSGLVAFCRVRVRVDGDSA